MNMRVLISGGRGFVGYYVCKKFREMGHEVFIMSNLSHPSAQTRGQEYIYGDIRYQHDCDQAIKDVDIVIHLAAKIHVDRSREFTQPYFDTNILGTYNVLEACRKFKKKMIHASSSEALGSYYPDKSLVDGMNEMYRHNPENPYGTTKAAADMLCIGWHNSFKLDVTLLRSFNISGAGQSWDKEGAFLPKIIERVYNNQDIEIFGGGEQTRDYLWVGDVAEAYYLLAMGDYAGQVFHTGTGREVTINHMAETLIKISGKDLKVVHIGARPNEVRRLKCDASKIRALGWRPTKTAEEILQEMWKERVSRDK
jgi:nucleoside-diphosphate-sugar epimerase